MKQPLHVFWLVGSLSFCFQIVTSAAQAQSIQIDKTTPTTPGTCTGSCTIEGGLQRGSNLLHSFSQFNVDSGATVLFLDPGVTNILSRVTGTYRSDILGTLGVLGGNANLFLINPNGIIFGPNASLDVRGSFVATTANAIQFGNQGFFSASAPDVPAALTVNPSAFFFNQIENAPIQNNSIAPAGLSPSGMNVLGLRVPDSRSLLLVGGDVSLENGGRLNAFGGRVDLGGLAEPGAVGLTVDGNSLRLDLPDGVPQANVSLSSGARADVTGEGGGSIAINARNLGISEGSRLLAGIEINRGAVGTQAGDITLNATGAVIITDGSKVLNRVRPRATGNGGNISITARELSLRDGRELSVREREPTELSASTLGQGNAGSVFVQASDRVSLESGSLILSNVETQAIGNGGDISITAKELFLRNESFVSAAAFGRGKVGNVFVRAADAVSLESDSRIGSTVVARAVEDPEDPGEVSIYASSLSLTNGAQIATFSVSDPESVNTNTARGGNILIRASDFVKISGFSSEFPSGLFASAGENTVGSAGNITVNTGQLLVQNGAEVSVRSDGTGNAGDLEVTADSIRLDNEGKLTATSESGEGGDIKLQDLDLLLLRDNSQISTTAGGTKRGGDITIDTDLLVGLENSDITANAFEGEGGFIQITAQGIFGLEVIDTINDINELEDNNTSDISAASRQDPSLNGEVEINRTEADISSGLVFLPTELVDISELIAQGCSAGGGNTARESSKFVATGRGGLPPTPTEAFRSDPALADLGTPVQGDRDRASATSTNPTTSQPTSIVEAQGWMIGPQGEVILIAETPSVTPHIPWLPHTSCNRL